jgi:hypothetical protein
MLHIFVEKFDYRTLKGVIELLVYDEGFNLVRIATVLRRPWHLSYPYVFEAEGVTWMLPEARRSGELTLYRAAVFPDRWEPASVIGLGGVVDATPIYHGGRWWLFYSRLIHGQERSSELNVAFAKTLNGPWHQHPMNPVRRGQSSSRPAGTPIVRADGVIDLPVQDCSQTYGASVRRLRVTELNERSFEASDSSWLEPSPAVAPYSEGLHTLSAAGQVTLIDCKLIEASLRTSLARLVGSSARRFRRLGSGV